MTPAVDPTEQEVQQLARSLYHQAAEDKPSIFEPQDWLGKMIEWSLEDETLRVALFRFVDVLPSLDSAAEIGRHLEEYFAKVDHAFGGLVFLAQALRAGWLLAPVARHNVTRLARRFIVDEEPSALRSALETLRKEPAAFTLDVVGEATVSEKEALVTQRRYLDLLQSLSAISTGWPVIPQVDQGPDGPLPRINLSVKASALCARFDPLDPDSEGIVRERLRPLFGEAARVNAALTLDMEQHSFKDLTVSIFRGLLEESEFQSQPRAAIAIQAYLRDAEHDVKELIQWARARKRRIGVRLVKGAYWDSEITWAKQKGWPIPVFLEKTETDANYERLTRLLLESYDVVDAAFGSHNIRSLAHAIVTAQKLGVPKYGYEIQMLYGMGEPIRQAIIRNGQRVRVYLPVGRLLPGMAYLIRRLMENTSNTSFLRQTYAEEEQIDKLIVPPMPNKTITQSRKTARKRATADAVEPFQNEPLLDFAREANRTRFAESLKDVRRKFVNEYRLWIGGEEVRTRKWLESVNPAAPEEVIGRVSVAGRGEAERAVVNAVEFFPEWSRTAASERAAFMFSAADIMRRRRIELAAWEVFEVGKGWREADADVAEAIDYLEYYGREMLRLSQPRATQKLPGESNVYLYEPRGIAAVIAPWNFPLAILTGMMAASVGDGKLHSDETSGAVARDGRLADGDTARSRVATGRLPIASGRRRIGSLPGAAPCGAACRVYRFSGSWPGNSAYGLRSSTGPRACKAGRVRDGRQECHHRRRGCRSGRSCSSHPRVGLWLPGSEVFGRLAPYPGRRNPRPSVGTVGRSGSEPQNRSARGSEEFHRSGHRCGRARKDHRLYRPR